MHVSEGYPSTQICGSDRNSGASGVHGLLHCERDGKHVLTAPGYQSAMIMISSPSDTDRFTMRCRKLHLERDHGCTGAFGEAFIFPSTGEALAQRENTSSTCRKSQVQSLRAPPLIIEFKNWVRNSAVRVPARHAGSQVFKSPRTHHII